MNSDGSEHEEPSGTGELPAGQPPHGPVTASQPEQKRSKPKPTEGRLMLVFTAILAFAALGTLGVLAHQVAIMEGQRDISRRQAEISEYQTVVYEAQTTILEEHRELLLGGARAWVLFASVRRTRPPFRGVANQNPFMVTLKNFGLAPALDVSVTCWTRVHGKHLPELKPSCTEGDSMPTTNGLGTVPAGEGFLCSASADGAITEAEIADIDAATRVPFVFGIISYRDHTGRFHATKFCRHIKAFLGQWVWSNCGQRECAS